MPNVKYKELNIGKDRLELIAECNKVITEFNADGLRLTLRQLYYQLVSRNVIRNLVKEYKRLGDTVNDGRLAGLIDWSAIEDRTRNLETIGHWNDPADIIDSCASSFRLDKWADQPYRVEVWIEKEALANVFDRCCSALDVPFFACRGYTSQSEMWAAAMRFVRYLKGGQSVRILHFGDHDPSGIDMSRDIADRLRMFAERHVGGAVRNLSVQRIALNMKQVEEYDPPENPAKTTDARFAMYEDLFGDKSWELDALNPLVLSNLVRGEIAKLRDEESWEDMLRKEAEYRAELALGKYWTDVGPVLIDKYKKEYRDTFENELSDAQLATTCEQDEA